MNKTYKHIGFWVSLLVMIIVVGYSLGEWFDNNIPFSSSLYILSGMTIASFLVNLYYLFKKKT